MRSEDDTGDWGLTYAVVAIAVEIEAVTTVTLVHQVVQVEAALFTRISIFTQT